MQYYLSVKKEKEELRKKAIDLKNQHCVTLWNKFADTYKYLYYSGSYSPKKIDLDGLSLHIKALNVHIIRAEPFITHPAFLELMNARDFLDGFFVSQERGLAMSHKEYMEFINKL